MERTGITIKHFYSTTYVRANRQKQRRQNRTTDEENKDLEILLVRRCWLRKNLNCRMGRVGRPTEGEMQGSTESGKHCVMMLCYDAVLGLCSVNCGGGSLNKHQVNKFICFNFHILFILPLHTKTVFTLNFSVNALLIAGLCVAFLNLQCSKNTATIAMLQTPKQFIIILFPKLFFPFNIHIFD